MLAANGSIFTILAISFERYYAICKPLKAGYKCTRLRAMLIICLIWLLSSVLTSPILIMAKSSQTVYIDGSLVYNCILETDSYWPKMYVFISMFAFFCVPLLVLMVVYWLISRRLIREDLAISLETSASKTATNATYSNEAIGFGAIGGAKILSQRLLRANRMVGGIRKATSLKSVSSFLSSLHHHPSQISEIDAYNVDAVVSTEQHLTEVDEKSPKTLKEPTLRSHDYRKRLFRAGKTLSLDQHLIGSVNDKNGVNLIRDIERERDLDKRRAGNGSVEGAANQSDARDQMNPQTSFGIDERKNQSSLAASLYGHIYRALRFDLYRDRAERDATQIDPPSTGDIATNKRKSNDLYVSASGSTGGFRASTKPKSYTTINNGEPFGLVHNHNQPTQISQPGSTVASTKTNKPKSFDERDETGNFASSTTTTCSSKASDDESQIVSSRRLSIGAGQIIGKRRGELSAEYRAANDSDSLDDDSDHESTKLGPNVKSKGTANWKFAKRWANKFVGPIHRQLSVSSSGGSSSAASMQTNCTVLMVSSAENSGHLINDETDSITAKPSLVTRSSSPVSFRKRLRPNETQTRLKTKVETHTRNRDTIHHLNATTSDISNENLSTEPLRGEIRLILTASESAASSTSSPSPHLMSSRPHSTSPDSLIHEEEVVDVDCEHLGLVDKLQHTKAKLANKSTEINLDCDKSQRDQTISNDFTGQTCDIVADIQQSLETQSQHKSGCDTSIRDTRAQVPVRTQKSYSCHRIQLKGYPKTRRNYSQTSAIDHQLGHHRLSESLVAKEFNIKKQHVDSRRQVVVMLAFVVTCFFVLFFPYRLFTIWLILSTEDQVQSLGMETYYNLTYFSRILIYLHSAINPIAYNLISTKFRSAFMSILLCKGPATRRKFTTDHKITSSRQITHNSSLDLGRPSRFAPRKSGTLES